MNEILRINLQELQEKIERNIFGKRINEKFAFLPAVLYQTALSLHMKISVEEIENWEDFETGSLDFDEKDFEKMILNKKSSISQIVYFVSDETIKSGFCFKFNVSDFRSFVTQYECEFNMAFFQPLDYIIVFENPWKIEMIYHEGKIITIYPVSVN